VSTGNRSSGYKGKPTSEPASKGVTGPSNADRATHAGKTSAAKKGVALAKEYETPPSTSKVRQHAGKQRGPAKKKERKQLAEANNTNIYDGETKPRTQHQKAVAARGKAVRKTLDIKNTKGKRTTTPYQNIKQTSLIREGQKQLLNETVAKLGREIRTNKLDPKTRKERAAEKTALEAEVHRLNGRKKLADLRGESKADIQGVGPMLSVPKLKGKAAAKQYAAAKKDFQRFDHLQKEAVRKSEEAVDIPLSKGRIKREIHNHVVLQPERPAKPFEVSGLLGRENVEKDTKRYNKEHSPGFNNALQAKGDKFYIPKQKIPGDKWGGEIGGGWYTRREIEALTQESRQAASEPSAVSDLITAASLAPIAPEAKLLQLAGKGVEALKAASKGAEAADDVFNFSKGITGGVTQSDIGARLADTEPALKQAADGKVSFNVGAKLADDGAAKLDTAIGDTLPAADKAKLIEKADSPLNKTMETHAEDPRVMSGSGAPEDVNEAMWQSAAREARKTARSSVTGLALKSRRGIKVAGVGAATLGPVAVVSQDFRENAYRDVHDLIAGFVPSSVQFLTASGDALLNGLTLGMEGSNSPLEAIWKQMQKTDPFVLALQGKWSQAEKSFAERPISGLIEAGGLYKGIGTVAGTAVREGMPGDFGTIADINGDTKIHIHGNFYKINDKSPNIFTQGVQALGKKLEPTVDPDKVKKVTGKDGREEFQYGSRREKRAAKLAGQKQNIELEKIIDHHESVNLIHSRQEMKETEHEISDIAVRTSNKGGPWRRISKKDYVGKHAASALTMISSKLIRSPKTAMEDLETWRKHLEHNLATKGPNEDSSLLRDNLSIVNTLLKHPEYFKDEKLWNAAEEYRQKENGRQQELIAGKAVDPKATEYAPWIPYAVHHMGANPIEGKAGFEINGRELSLDDIKAHAKEHDVLGEPAMVTTKVIDGAENGEFEKLTLPSLDNMHSAGKAIQTGNFDIATRSLLRQSVISRQIIDTRNYLMSMMNDGALRAPGQKGFIKFKNKAEADSVNAREFGVHGLKMTPVNFTKFVKDLSNGSNFDQEVNGARAKALYKNVDEITRNSLLETGAKADDTWVLVPERMIERMNQHQKGIRQVGSIIRRINREFKGSVLAFSPKWHVGNLVDMATRMYFQGVGLQSYAQGARLLAEVKRVDPATYNDIMAQIMGGHLKSSGDIIRQAEGIDQRVFDQHQIAAVRAASTAMRLGGKGYRKLQEISFGVGGEFEHIARTAGFGKVARLEARRLGYKWTDAIKMQHDVLTDLAEHLSTDTNIQMKYGKAVNSIFGDYTTMSPEVRFAMQTYAPFLMWLRASTKWALTLPKESPIRAAMITSVNRLNEPERRKLGLSVFHKGAESVPEYLLGSVDAGGGKLYRTQAYTSFGPLTDLEGLAEYALPQFNSLIEAWKGKDWLGEEIVNPDGSPLTDPERISITVQKMLETYVAPLGYIHKIIAHGDPSETFSIFDLDQLAKGPKALLEGAEERKHYKNTYGYSQEEKEEVKEEEPSEENIFKKVFSPNAKINNPVLKNKKYERESKEGVFASKTKKDAKEEVEDSLFGASHTAKSTGDKRRKKSQDVVESNLFK
jgi:hypothetical protein